MRLQHFLQTRFSVKDVSWAWERFPEDWLESRLALFETYCLPSVRAQTSREFSWLIYCDESTDPRVRSSLESHSGEVPMLRVVVTGPERQTVTATRDVLDPDADLVITTRLDSDDALNVNYIEFAQAYAEPFLRSRHRTLLLNFPRGYKLDVASSEVYESRIFNSSYPSLFERDHEDGSLQTVLSGSHSRFHQIYPCHQDESLAAWLQVLHGGNMINHRWSGEPQVPRETLREGFVLAETGRSRYYSQRPDWQPSTGSNRGSS